MKKITFEYILLISLLLLVKPSFADNCLDISEKLNGKWTYSQEETEHIIEFESGNKQAIHDGNQKEMQNCLFIQFGAPKASFYLKNDFTAYSVLFPKENSSTDNLKLKIGFSEFDLIPYELSQSDLPLEQTTFRWESRIGMDEQIFPSLIIATATWSDSVKKKFANNKNLKGAELIGDPNGLVDVVIQNIEPETNVRIEVSLGALANPSVFEGVLAESNKIYVIRPRVDFDYQALLSIKQPMPLNAKIVLYINGDKVGEKIKTVTVRSINDAPSAFSVGTNDEFIDYKWMFAAYVNENHPWIDQLLREAINTGVVDGVYGYQRGTQGVYQQVFAIWNVLQRRGVRYSSITTPTGSSDKVYSQYVRFLEDSINTSQANCIDGTVLFASILRRIGINSQIVLVPSHAFLRFNLNESGSQYAHLETTMLGNTNLGNYVEDKSLLRVLGAQTKNRASEYSFRHALFEGSRKANSVASSLRSNNNPNYQLIDIDEARKLGVAPINH